MKHAIVNSEPRMLDVIQPGDQMDRAGRINYFHTLSKQAGEVSIKAALWCGMELFKAKMEHSGTFEIWLEQNVNFHRMTAYRYLALLQQSIGSEADLTQVADFGTKKRQELVEAYASHVESKNMTEMMIDYGIIKKSKSNLGGKREGAGRKRKVTDADLAAQAEAIANSGELAKTEITGKVSDLYRAAIVEGGFGCLSTEDLKSILVTLGDIVRKGGEILKTRKDR